MNQIYHCRKNPNIICEAATYENMNTSCETCSHNKEKVNKTVKLEISVAEFNMLIKKLEWMRCIVRDSNLEYQDYCNGECDNCQHPEFHNIEDWLKSKIIKGEYKYAFKTENERLC